jgi:hypothetical protein
MNLSVKSIIGTIVFLLLMQAQLFSQVHQQHDTPHYSFDLHKISPKQLFSVLKFSSDTAKGVNFITVGDAPTNWIQFADVKYLVRFINSHEKCKCVIKVYSDYLPFDNYSTLGGQAMNLIDSYRKKEPYFEGTWNCGKNDDLRAQKITSWFKSLNKKK